MHENIFVMQMICNAEDFKIKSLKPIPKKFEKTSSIWKIPNIFQKPQFLGQKIWKCKKKKD